MAWQTEPTLAEALWDAYRALERVWGHPQAPPELRRSLSTWESELLDHHDLQAVGSAPPG